MDALIRQYPQLKEAFASSLQTNAELLQGNSSTVGESRDRGRRICFADPLAVEFRVVETLQKVYVLGLSLWTRLT